MRAIGAAAVTAVVWVSHISGTAATDLPRTGLAAVATQDSFHVVSPGSKELRPARLGTGRWQTSFFRVVEGKDTGGNPYYWDVRRAKEAGRDVILSVQFSTNANGGYDSTFIDARTLAPVAYRSRNPGDTMLVSFNAAHYSAKQKNVKLGEKSAEGNLPQPAFDGTAADIVIGALPLADGYTARLPVFMPVKPDSIGTISWQTVRVLGSAETQGRAVWKIETQTSHGTQTALIDKETGAMLDRRMQIPNMGELHMVRTLMHE